MTLETPSLARPSATSAAGNRPDWSFTYEPHPIRTIAAPGTAKTLDAELGRLGIARAMVLTTPTGANRYAAIIGAVTGREIVPYSEAAAHSPERVSLDALATFLRTGCDGLVSIGGGSTTGLGKFIAASTGKSLVAIPTTLSGSDMTPIYGWKADGEKHTRIDPRAMPRTILYDPELHVGLPAGTTVRSAMNCLAHLVEALYPAQPNRIAAALAAEGMRALVAALPAAIREPMAIAPRAQLCYAAFLGGHLVSVAGIGLHHKLCHLIGGMTDISHGDNNSVVLPHVVALNAPCMGEEAAVLTELFGPSPGSGLQSWAAALDAPVALGPLGLEEDMMQTLVDRVMAQPPANPAPLDRDVLGRLLEGIRTGILRVWPQ